MRFYGARLVSAVVKLVPPVTECNIVAENLAVVAHEEKLTTMLPFMVASGATFPTTSGSGVVMTGEQAVPAV